MYLLVVGDYLICLSSPPPPSLVHIASVKKKFQAISQKTTGKVDFLNIYPTLLGFCILSPAPDFKMLGKKTLNNTLKDCNHFLKSFCCHRFIQKYY